MSTIPKRFWQDDLEVRLQRAVDKYNLPEKPEFSNLAELSYRTEFDGIEVHGSAAVLINKILYAPATVHVTLHYGEHDGAGEQPVSFSDTYPARVKFIIEDDEISVEEISVDTSSFYE